MAFETIRMTALAYSLAGTFTSTLALASVFASTFTFAGSSLSCFSRCEDIFNAQQIACAGEPRCLAAAAIQHDLCDEACSQNDED